MNRHTEIKKLQKENEKIQKKINELLDRYMMSADSDDTLEMINQLVENELQQEELCD